MKLAVSELIMSNKFSLQYKLLLHTKFIVNFLVLEKHSKKYKVDRNQQYIVTCKNLLTRISFCIEFTTLLGSGR